jgi:hypothetical protein
MGITNSNFYLPSNSLNNKLKKNKNYAATVWELRRQTSGFTEGDNRKIDGILVM